MPAKKNELDELAKDLNEIVRDTRSDFYSTRIRKAQRIIAELAKVRSDKDGCPTCFQSIDAVKKCREIAKEVGVK